MRQGSYFLGLGSVSGHLTWNFQGYWRKRCEISCEISQVLIFDYLPDWVAWISSSFIATCSPRAPYLVNWRGCWLLIVATDCRRYSWSESCSSGWWSQSWTISCCCCCCWTRGTVWQLMFLLTAVAAPLMRVWVLSKQLMEAGLFLLCNSSLTILLISSVVFTGTGTMLSTLPPWLSILKRKFYRFEDPYFQDQILLLEVFQPPFVTNLKTSNLKTTAVEPLNKNLFH